MSRPSPIDPTLEAARPAPWQRLWRALRPTALAIDRRERWRVVAGAWLGVGLVAMLAWHWPPAAGLPWLLAPLGASAVLVYALPASPLAQPWAVVGGNTLSALVGLLCTAWVPWPPLAAALAVAGAIAAMMAARCLHPPGGAVALLTVVAGIGDAGFALAPVALDSALLVACGLLYNPLTGRRYPHAQDLPRPAPAEAGRRAFDFSADDLDRVLARYNQVLDVPRDDLRDLLVQAEHEAGRRRLQTLRCRDIMTADPLAVNFGTPLAEAWQRLRGARIKALPVVDRYGHVMGIVTQADFLRHAGLDEAGGPQGLDHRLRQLLRPSPLTHADKPETVGQIMSRQVRVASADRPIADLIALFSHEGHHHLPIIGERNRLVGIITQTDVIAALAAGTGT